MTMRPPRAALVIISAGLMTFGLVFMLLQVTRSAAAPTQAVLASTPAQPMTAQAADSLAARLASGHNAIGIPVGESEPLLRDVQAGDRLDVLASLPSPDDGRPVTAVVVRGAMVLRPAASGEPLMVEVPGPDAIALAHLVLGGTRLSYVVWPSSGGAPLEPQPLDEQSARALLGLGVGASERAATPEPAPTAAPTLVTVVPRPGGFLYQVQPGDTWDSVAAIFSVSAAELQRVNEAPPGAGPDAWSLLFIPRKS